MITSCCPGRDAFDGCSCPDPDLHLDLDLCDDCGRRLEEKEVGLCNECEADHENANERAAERRDEAFYGASSPQTLDEHTRKMEDGR